MNLFDMAEDVAQGNPGAMVALGNMMMCATEFDDRAWGKRFQPIMNCQDFGIQGPMLWMLFKDVCGMDAVKTQAVFRAIQMGIVSKESVKSICYGVRNDPHGLWLDDTLNKLKEKASFLNLDHKHETVHGASILAEALIKAITETEAMMNASKAAKEGA